LQEFVEAVFLGVVMESILGDEEASSGHTRVTTQKTVTFDLTVISRSHFYRNLWRLFSFELL
jgi:hypothetical protein